MKTASQSDITAKQESFKKQLEATHKNLLQLSWYMRGGVSISELHDMPVNHLTHINEIVNENFELSKKAGTPIL